jgi:hypothetical protein
MTTVRPITLPDYSADNLLWKEFYGVFRDTINPQLTVREFKHFYHFEKPKEINVDFIYSDERLVGFIAAAFYPSRNADDKRKITIARGTAGILPDCRGGMMPSFRLCLKYIRYKMAHPLEQVYVTGYMANPKLYAMMCNYAHRVYPKINISEPGEIKALRDSILKTKHRMGEHLVKLHFPVLITEKEKSGISRSEDEHMKYFLRKNPQYDQQIGLFTIIPVDAGNIFHSLKMHVQKRLKKYVRRQSELTSFKSRGKNSLAKA